MVHTRKLQLADPKLGEEPLPIEILIGGDHYWKVIEDNAPIRISSFVATIPSIFGWILSGNRSGITISSAVVNYINSEQPRLPSDDVFRHFWVLETIGIKENQVEQQRLSNSSWLQWFLPHRGSTKSNFSSGVIPLEIDQGGEDVENSEV